MSQLSSTRPSMQTSDGLVCSPLRPDDHSENTSGKQLNLAALWRMQDPSAGRNGRILRNPAARSQFLRQTGYPHGRPGYVVDHIVPLECGGADSPSNMQWQTVAEARAKDRTEGNCRR